MTQVTPVRLIIVDDHDLVRRGIRSALVNYPEIEVVTECSNGAEAIASCSELRPDVVLMDLRMPGVDGVAATRAIHKQNQDVQIIVLTSYDDENLVHEALEAGALSYLLKNIGVHDLAEAIKKAHARKSTLAKEATQALINTAVRPASPFPNLTRREKQVLQLMATGSSNIEIADQLTVSISTAKKHVSNILEKLNVRTRTEAVSLAFQHHLIDETSHSSEQ